MFKIDLEKGNPEVGSLISVKDEGHRIMMRLKDCDESIGWRFYYKDKDQIVDSIIKAERAIVALQEVQAQLKAKLEKTNESSTGA